jgi:hypothetical protein
MSNVYKFCSCRGCKAGRHCNYSKQMTRYVMRAFRQRTKRALKAGKEPPTKISIPYTD